MNGEAPGSGADYRAVEPLPRFAGAVEVGVELVLEVVEQIGSRAVSVHQPPSLRRQLGRARTEPHMRRARCDLRGAEHLRDELSIAAHAALAREGSSPSSCVAAVSGRCRMFNASCRWSTIALVNCCIICADSNAV